MDGMILILLRTVTPSVCQQQVLAILARDAPHTNRCSPDVCWIALESWLTDSVEKTLA